jgi:hypothetical protein
MQAKQQQIFPGPARIFLLREIHDDLRLAVVARRSTAIKPSLVATMRVL